MRMTQIKCSQVKVQKYSCKLVYVPNKVIIPLAVVPLLISTTQTNCLPLSEDVNSSIVIVALYTAELPTMMGSTSSKVSGDDAPNDPIDISTLLVIPLTAVTLHSSVRG